MSEKEPLFQSKKDCFVLRCFNCEKRYEIDDYGKFYFCTSCGGLLEVKLVTSPKFERRKFHDALGIWSYWETIPVWNEANIVSLQEGNTALLKCSNLGRLLGIKSLYVKFEGLNPTGSFKDRGMTVGISKAKEVGFKKVICASTGNTSASLAAYSARSGLGCTVLIPKGKIAIGKVAQSIVYGARIIQIEGNFDDCLSVAQELCEKNHELLLLNSLNPFRIEGQKTAAFEIFEQLGRMPGNVILPVGNGGNISSYWKGFKEIVEFSLLQGIDEDAKLPKMIGVQAEGAAPIASAYQTRSKTIRPVDLPHTEASAINIGSPVNWPKALRAIYDSRGYADLISDEEILAAQKLLASTEGIFVEPASAAPIAYLSKISRKDSSSSYRDQFDQIRDSVTVCIATGNGLKDPNIVIKSTLQDNPRTVSSDTKSLEEILLSL